MALLGIDKAKLTLLLRLGFHHKQISDFFKSCREELIEKGVEIRYLPVKEKAFEKFIELPASVDPLILTWLQNNINLEEPEPVLSVIGILNYLEMNMSKSVSMPAAETDLKKYALSTLQLLTKEEPDQILLDYLRTPYQTLDLEPGLATPEPTPEPIVQIVDNGISLDIFESALTGKAPDFTDKSTNFVDSYYILKSMLLFSTSKYQEAYRQLTKVSPDCAFKSKLQHSIQAAEASTIDTDEEYLFEEYDPDEFEVIAYSRTQLPAKNAFLVPVAFIDNQNKILSIDYAKRNLMFPSNGQMIYFPSQNYAWLPKLDEILIWRAKKTDNDRLIKTHAILNERRPIHQVFFIEYPPDQTELIRERIKSILTVTEGLRYQPIFCLDNQIYISGKPNQSRAIDDNGFYANMVAWKNLTKVNLLNKTYVLGPLPSNDFLYNCAPVSYIFSSLLKNEMERVSLGLNKNQVSFLSNYLDGFTDKVGVSNIEYIKKGLNSMLDSKEDIDIVVKQLLELPIIKKKVDTWTELMATKLLAQKNTIVDDIAKLKNDRQSLLSQIEKTKEEINTVPNKLFKEIKKRFEQAKDEGLKELANIAFYRSFLPSAEEELSNNNSNNGNGHHLKGPVKRLIEPIKSEQGKNGGSPGYDPREELELLGLSPNQISSLLSACEMSRQVGLMVGVKGLGSRLIAESLAKLVGSGYNQNGKGNGQSAEGSTVVIDMEVGVLSCDQLNSVLIGNGSPLNTLAILDANLSALDIYARSLFDYVLNRIAKNKPPYACIILSLSDSPLAVKVAPHFLQNMILIDLDSYSEDGLGFKHNPQEVKESLLNKEEGALLSTLFWPPLSSKLYKYINGLGYSDNEHIKSLAALMIHQKRGRPRNESELRLLT
jgi:hypothetical protein